ncbi:MAG: hypothetical protein H0W83_04730, partial [Planctomycetes bacterium]|nr:hypothetical protein [Planctomycetota bacterium]
PVVSLIPADLAAGTAGGYRYAVFLPNADGGALAEPDGSDVRPKDAKAADAQEGMWIAYAWPANAKTGAKMFAMTEDGQIRSATYLGEDPRWDDVFNGGGWGADPGWDPYEAP